MSDKWTPAPWAQTPYSSVLGVVITAQPDATQNSQRVASVGGPQVRRVIEANARMIAAAPDLYQALAFAVSCIKSGEPWTAECERIIGAALAKARGLA